MVRAVVGGWWQRQRRATWLMLVCRPVLVTYLLTFGLPIISIIFVGHIDKDKLAAAGSCARQS
jgi:hypothetical protein